MKMPAENIVRMPVQKKTLVPDIHLHPEPKSNAAHGESSNAPKEEASSSVLSNKETTNRSLSVFSNNETINGSSSILSDNETTNGSLSVLSNNETTKGSSSVLSNNETTNGSSSVLSNNETTNGSSSVLFNNEITNNLKRPLFDQSVYREAVKKFKLAENMDDEQNEDFSLLFSSNINDEKDCYAFLTGRIVQITGNRNSKNVENLTIEDNNHNDPITNHTVDNDKIINLIGNKSICKEVNKNTINKKSTNRKIEDINDSIIILNGCLPTDTTISNMNLELNGKSSSAAMDIVENTDHEYDEISQTSESIGKAIINITKRKREKKIKRKKSKKFNVKINESATQNGLILNKSEENICNSVIENAVEMIENDTISNDPVDKDDEPVSKDAPISEDNEPVSKDNALVIKDNESVSKDAHFSTDTELVNKDAPISENNEPVSKDTAVIKDNEFVLKDNESVSKDNEPVSKVNEPVSKDNVPDKIIYITDNNDDDYEIILSDSSSDMSDDESYDEELVNEIIAKLHKLSKKNFTGFIKLLMKSNLPFQQFESVCTQNMIGVFTEKGNMGEIRSKIQLLEYREKLWRDKFTSLSRQMKEVKAVLKMHMNDLNIDKLAKPHVFRRTVGLQAVISPVSQASQVSPLPSTSKGLNSVQLSNADKHDTIDITIIDDDDDDEDDDDVMILETEINEFPFKPSTSKTIETSPKKILTYKPSLSKTIETTPTKVLTSKPSTSKTIETTPKKITPSSPVMIRPSSVILTRVCSPTIPLNIANNDINGTIDLTGPDETIDVTNRLNTEHSPNKIVKYSAIHSFAGTSSAQLKHNLSTQVDFSSVAFIELSKLPPSSSGYIVQTSSTTGLTQLMPVPVDPSQPVKPFLLNEGRLLPVQSPLQQLPRPELTGSLLPVPPAIPILNHPADLPPIPNQRSLPAWKKIPPAPKLSLSLSKEDDNPRALILSWNMNLSNLIADISTYQIYAYHEIAIEVPRQELWRKIGEVNALPLPMACSLTQFSSGENYHFAVRAVDIHTRVGPFSEPKSIYNPK